jgi:hypothetical protein
MGVNIGSGWRIASGWVIIGGPPPGTEIVTISGLNITTLSGDLLITI